MSDLATAVRAARPRPADALAGGDRRTDGQLVRRALLVVVGFWWLATGLAIAMQRSGTTRALALLVATALAVGGAALLVQARDQLTARTVVRSFVGGALLWLWVAVTFYGGWIVGPAAAVAAAPAGPSAGTLARALQALHATAYTDAASVGALLLALALTHGRPNRTGAWALLLFFGAHQLARLNVFAGVANPARELLPDYLAHLAHHFGPATNSPLLAVSVAALVLLVAWLARRVRRAACEGARQAGWLLLVLGVLALLEHVLLGVPGSAALWVPFLDLRG